MKDQAEKISGGRRKPRKQYTLALPWIQPKKHAPGGMPGAAWVCPVQDDFCLSFRIQFILVLSQEAFRFFVISPVDVFVAVAAVSPAGLSAHLDLKFSAVYRVLAGFPEVVSFIVGADGKTSTAGLHKNVLLPDCQINCQVLWSKND